MFEKQRIINNKRISFSAVMEKAQQFVYYILNNEEKILLILNEYETHSVAKDEVSRSIDLLLNLNENSEYFHSEVKLVKSYLPQNQPLYSFVCFAIVPSLMSEGVIVRPPEVMTSFFKRLVIALNVDFYFPNIHIFYGDRLEFTKLENLKTSAVIFTGKSETALNVRKMYNSKTLFILNGSGHNPVVVTKWADINQSVENILRVTLQNQGQDCAAPNAILVHRSILIDFRKKMIERLKDIDHQVGPYDDWTNIIGPNNNDKQILKIAKFFIHNKKYVLRGADLNPATGIIRPTLLEKNLNEGAQLEEFYAPIIMLQPYDVDSELATYFENPKYFPNSMYITVFGRSDYVKSLVRKGLHHESSILYDTNLHVVERGFKEYGGLGPRASCIYCNNKKVCGPTLPQRDIFTYLVKPHL